MLERSDFSPQHEDNLRIFWAALDFLIRMGLAINLAHIAGPLIETSTLRYGLIVIFFIGLILTLASGYQARANLSSAEVATTGKLEDICLKWFENAHYSDVQSWRIGDLVSRVQTHPKSLAIYWVSYPVARAMAMLGATLVLLVLPVFSWQAAVLLFSTLPIIAMIMALIGGMINNAAQKRETETQYLSALFADRIRTLPTILAHDAQNWAQHQLLVASRLHAKRTMEVLKIAFLNSAVLDFFSSLSIAMLAIFLGLGHLGLANIPGFIDLTLSQSLSILLLAPMFFMGFRKFAELYHAKADGEAAIEALAPYVKDRSVTADFRKRADCLEVRNIILPYCNKIVGFKSQALGLIVISGQSGSGKTTLLRCMAGVEQPVSGTIHLPIKTNTQSWCSSELFVAQGSLADAISYPEQDTSCNQIEKIASKLDLGKSDYLPNGTSTKLDAGAVNLSGGQRMRLALARALYSEPDIIFCDEPTAKLDQHSAELVRQALKEAAKLRLVIVASHDPLITNMAHFVFDMHLAPISTEARMGTGQSSK